MPETKIVFAESELDPTAPSPRDRRDELRALLRDAVRTKQTMTMINGDAKRASCSIETADGSHWRIVIERGVSATTLLRRYLHEAGFID